MAFVVLKLFPKLTSKYYKNRRYSSRKKTKLTII